MGRTIGAVRRRSGIVDDVSAQSGTEHALAAARAVAFANSLACDDAAVLAAGSNVLVHLKPAPVVARVMTGTAMLHNDIERWLSREVATGAFLGQRGLAVPPSELMAPGPYQHEGHWMTFWHYVEHDPSGSRPRAQELGASLRELHDALADFSGELGPLSDVHDWLDRLLAELRPSAMLAAHDIDLLRARLQELTPTVFESLLPVQPIHGDASMGNLLRTNQGLIWNDLEDVCVGPVHWDIAGLVVEARDSAEGEVFVSDFLHAYGEVALDQLDDFIETHRIYSIVWQAFVAQRRPASTQQL